LELGYQICKVNTVPICMPVKEQLRMAEAFMSVHSAFHHDTSK